MKNIKRNSLKVFLFFGVLILLQSFNSPLLEEIPHSIHAHSEQEESLMEESINFDLNDNNLSIEKTLACRQIVNGILPGQGYRFEDRTFNLSCFSPGTIVTIEVNALMDSPNRFTILNPSPGDDYNSNWIGVANYPGPWSVFGGLHTNSQYTLSFAISQSGYHTLRIETYSINNNADNYTLNAACCKY